MTPALCALAAVLAMFSTLCSTGFDAPVPAAVLAALSLLCLAAAYRTWRAR